MGGFGALKCAAANPALFSAAVSISGITDLQWLMDHDPGRGEQFSAVFGGLQAMGENDLAGSFQDFRVLRRDRKSCRSGCQPKSGRR